MKRPFEFFRTVLILVVAGIAVLYLFHLPAVRKERSEPPVEAVKATPRDPVIPSTLGADERDNIQIFRDASASVAYITNTALRRDFFSLNVFEIPQGTGSGFIWDRKGHIVTNYHVIYGAEAIDVTLFDQSSYRAKLVGVDPNHDLAVIRISAPDEKLRPIKIGSSGDLLVGQKVLAIGNPFGLDSTLTVGIISALDREIESMTRRSIYGVIQTDAAINPGNSGGPLLDSGGRLIGVNTAIVSPSGSSAGLGFAVPVDTVKRVVPQLIARGKVARVGLGVSMVPAQWMRKWNLDGAMIWKVADGSAADKAGLRGVRRDLVGRIELGDIVVKADGKAIRDTDDLDRVLDGHEAGDVIELEVVRAKTLKQVTVQLQDLE
jgi:S1-C subfamily serine protease